MVSTFEPSWAKAMVEVAEPSNADEEVVLDFLAGMSGDPVATIERLYADEGTYQNVPSCFPVAVGKEAVKATMGALLGVMQMKEIVTFGLASKGGYVFTERIDRLKAGDKLFDLPVSGTLQVVNGKIVAWRDYFDLEDAEKGLDVAFH